MTYQMKPLKLNLMMNKFKSTRFQYIAFFSVFLLFVGVFIVIPIVFLGLLKADSLQERDSWGPSMVNSRPNEFMENKMGNSSIPLWYQFLNFDPTSGHLEANLYVWPGGNLTDEFSSATIPSIPTKLFIDNLYSKTSYNFLAGQSIGAINIIIDATNPLALGREDEFYYPFDQYSMDSYAKIDQGNSNNGNFSPAKTWEYVLQPQISNFKFDIFRGSTFQDKYDWFDVEAYSRDNVFSQRDNGEISLLILATRTNSVKFASILFFLSIFSASLALFLTTVAVARRKRPPSLTALVWSSASILGVIQLRDLMPGKPRIGILLDTFVFFPSIGLCIISVVILSFSWVVKKDYAI